MKTIKSITLFALAMSITVAASAAAPRQAAQKPAAAPAAKKINFAQDVDSLGGNEDLINMADSLKPETKSRIVQDRIVDRHNRIEFGVNYGGVAGGTTYLQTQNLGFNLDYHITPKWSLGLRYYDFNNKLTPEGERVFAEARANNGVTASGGYVDIDTPLNATMAVLNFFPVYGKLNLFDAAIAQFDVFMLVGGGQIELSSGPTSILTAGGGIGFWMTKHLTARLEARYQGYKDQIKNGSRDINSVVGTAGLGWIL
jgi:outer membrane immunogenic protein